MKTPREILFERHRAAEGRLSDIRKAAVLAIAEQHSPATHQPSVSNILDTIWQTLLSLRWHLAGMTTIWLLVLFLSASGSNGSTNANLETSSPSPQKVLASLRENRRQVLDLIGPAAAEPAPAPRRRSSLDPGNLLV